MMDPGLRWDDGMDPGLRRDDGRPGPWPWVLMLTQINDSSQHGLGRMALMLQAAWFTLFTCLDHSANCSFHTVFRRILWKHSRL